MIGSLVTLVVFGLVTFLLTYKRNWRAVWCAIVCLPRDLHFTYHLVKLRYKLRSTNRITTPTIFQELVDKHPEKPAFIQGDNVWTYKQVEEWSNQIAHYFKSIGVKKGDCIALFMVGCPEYPIVWFGISKIGAVASLINTNQTGSVLQRSIEICNAKWIIYGTEMTSALKDVIGAVNIDKHFYIGENSFLEGSENLTQVTSTHQKSPPMEDILMISLLDPMLYIYTSGTTGLPKAAIMTHARFAAAIITGKSMLSITSEDVIYTSLPLYHTAGGIIGVGLVILGGCTQVIRPKFSASNFFADCIKYKCTVAQYIGEICRFLLASPQRPEDRLHQVRLVFGNGLRQQVWKDFVERFNISQVAEIYGSTEGNANMLNAWNKIGAVGYIPWFLKRIFPLMLIKVDDETMSPLRGPDGLCIPCKQGEPGLVVGKIQNTTAFGHFKGYLDEGATKKKIITDIFKKGDAAFNSGDLLVEDEFGYLYFKDRTGDTFRWRGENVATSEIEEIIIKVTGLKDVIVYGVEIPNIEGKAGMAAILDNTGQLDLNAFKEGLKQHLPSYARPLFLRLINDLPLTGTFKIQKAQLQKDGYNPSIISDQLYFYDQKSDCMKVLDHNIFQDISTNEIKF